MQTERFHLAGAEVLVGADVDETMRIAAGQFAALSRKTAAEGRPVNVALSGGSTPRKLFQVLAAEPFAGLVPWNAIQFFWGDERNVPPSDSTSNYAMARDLLLTRVPVPAANIHRIPTGDGTAVEAADHYERTLREKIPFINSLPSFDYILLGLGSNGHTASLFPHRPTIHEKERFVVADHIEEVNTWRVTLTPPVLNNAKQVTFLVIGGDKASVVGRVIEGERDPEAAPAQLVSPVAGALTWIMDSAASGQLRRPAAHEQAGSGSVSVKETS